MSNMFHVLIDNATLNQSAICLNAYLYSSRKDLSSAARAIAMDLRPFFASGLSDGFIAALSSFVTGITLYDTIYALNTPNSPAVWQTLESKAQIDHIIQRIQPNANEIKLATELALFRLRRFFHIDKNRSDFLSLLQNLRAFIPRKRILETFADYELFSGQSDVRRIITEDLRELPSILDIFDRVMLKLFGGKYLNIIDRKRKMALEFALSLFYWIYYRPLYYDSLCSILTNIRHSQRFTYLPAQIRAERVRPFLDYADDEAVKLVERVVRSEDERAIRSLREEWPDLHFVALRMPPVFSYVLTHSSNLKEVIAVAKHLRDSDKSIRELRGVLREIRERLLKEEFGTPTSLEALFDAIVTDLDRRWRLGRTQTHSGKLVIAAKLPFFELKLELPSLDLARFIKRRKSIGAINVMSSFRFANREVARLGALYDRHFRPLNLALTSDPFKEAEELSRLQKLRKPRRELMFTAAAFTASSSY